MKKASAASSIPKLLNYQARITDDAGVPVPDGNLNIWISVYDAPSGGSCLYAMRGSCGTPSYKTVTVSSGVFSMLIGDTASGDNEIDDDLFDGNSLYLGVTVASDTEMVPRKRITAAPYAFNADRLDDLDVTSSGSDTASIVALTSNGNLVVTGDPQGGAVSAGSVYVNPGSASASETLFGIADDGSSRWSIDKEGDVAHTGSLLATAASSTAQFVFRGAASQSNNIFEVQDANANQVLTVSATATIVRGATGLIIDPYEATVGSFTFGAAGGLIADASFNDVLTIGTADDSFYLDAASVVSFSDNGVQTTSGSDFFTASSNQDRTSGSNLFKLSDSGATAAGATLLAITSANPSAAAGALLIDLDNGDANNVVFSVITDRTTGSGSGADASKFAITANGGISVLNGVSIASWPTANASGALTNDGSGNLTWAAAASTSLNQAYLNSTSTTEIFLTPSLGALTIADTFSGTGNIFEIQDRTGSAGAYSRRYFTVSATSTLFDPTGSSGYEIGIGTAAPTAALTVNGDAFIGTDLAIGNQYAIGVDAPSGYYGIELGKDTTEDGSVGIYTNVTHSPSGSGHIIEGQFVNVETATGNAIAIDQLAAYDGQSLLNGSGTANTLWGVLAKAVNNSSGAATYGIGLAGFPAITGTGQITHGIGLYAQSPLRTGSGSFQNAYGLYIEPQVIGAVSNYAIFYNRGVNGFFVTGNGDTGIGASSPNARLTVAASTTSPTANLFSVQNTGTGANGLERYFTVSATNVAVGFASASTTRALGVNWGINTNLTPLTDATYDLGEYNRRWRDLWLSGGSAKIAYDLSGSTTLRLGWESSQGLRSVIVSNGAPLEIRANSTTITGDLTLTGACIGCGGGASTLNEAYLNATGTPEISISPSIGALTVADTFSGTGNIFEITDRTNAAGDYGSRYFTASSTSTLLGLTSAGAPVSGYKFGLGASAPTEAFEIGSIDAFDGTNRIKLSTYEDTNSQGTSEVMRLYAMNEAAKPTIAYYDSASGSMAWLQTHRYLHYYDSRTFAPGDVSTGGDSITVANSGYVTGWEVYFTTSGSLPGGLSTSGSFFVRVSGSTLTFYDTEAHAIAGGGTGLVDITSIGSGTSTIVPNNLFNNNLHQHFSIEVADSTGAKQTRLSVPFGYDTTEMGTFSSNFNVNDGKLRVLGDSGSFKELQFGNTPSSNLEPDDTNIRWSMRQDNTAESGGNAGSDFRLVRYTDAGVAVDQPIFVRRSDGRAGFGTTSNLNAQVNAATSYGVQRADTSSFGSYTWDTAGTTQWSLQLRNDASNDLHLRDNINGRTVLFARQSTGHVGFGNLAPANKLTVGSATSTFEVDASGNILKVNNVPYSWPSSQGGASTVLTNNGSGVLTWSAAGGGTLQSVYTASTDPEITLDSTRGALTIADPASPLDANLFEIQDTSGGGGYTQRYFTVSATGVSLTDALFLDDDPTFYMNNGASFAIRDVDGNILLNLDEVSDVGDLQVTGDLYQEGEANLNGDVNLGDASGDSVAWNASTWTVNNALNMSLGSNKWSITSTSGVSNAIEVITNSITTASGIAGVSNGLTSGNGIWWSSSAAYSGNLLYLNPTANFTGDALDITANSTQAGTGINMTMNALTTGKGISVTSSGALTSGNLLNVSSSASSALSSGLVRIESTGGYTSSASETGMLTLYSQTSTGGTMLGLNGDNTSTGTLIHLAAHDLSTGSAIAARSYAGVGFGLTTGSLLDLDGYYEHDANEVGSMVRIKPRDKSDITSTTIGLLIEPEFSSASANMTRTLTGMKIDPTFASAGSNCNSSAVHLCVYNGIDLTTPSRNVTTANTTLTFNGLNLSSSGALNPSASGAYQRWNGITMAMPSASPSSGAVVSATAISITGPVTVGSTGAHYSILDVATSTFSVDTGVDKAINLNMALTSTSANNSGLLGINITPQFNLFNTSGGTKNIVGLNVDNPTYTQCVTGSGSRCGFYGAVIGGLGTSVTHTSNDTLLYHGLDINQESNTFIQSGLAGTIEWRGIQMRMPNITQTTGTVTSTGLQIIGGTVTSGTAYAITTDAAAGRVGIGTTSPVSGPIVHAIGGAFFDASASAHGHPGTSIGLIVDGAASTDIMRLRSSGASQLFTVDSSGNVGISSNDATPDFKLDVEAAAATVAGFNRLSNDGTIISLQQDGTEEGTISVSGTTVSYNAFTGSHYAWTDSGIGRGMLVSLTGEDRHAHGNPLAEILYGIAPSAVANDSKVLGSYLALQDPSEAADDENPHLVMAVGNGDLWVVDGGSDIVIGDFLISSDTAGHAMKDPGTHPVSHVVARATENVDWDTVTDTIGGKKRKKIIVTFEMFDRNNIAAVNHDGEMKLSFGNSVALPPPAYASATQTAIASRELSFIGSAWNSGSSTSVTREISTGLEIDAPDQYQFAFRNDDGNLLASLNQDGDLSIAGSLTVDGGFDYAESFPAAPDLDAGDIVMVDPANETGYGVKKSDKAYENSLIGVISTKPGFLTGKKEEGTQPVALAGRVPVKVNSEGGAINPGDPITSSSVRGVGMKALEAGRVIGIALEGWNGTGEGLITIFVNPSWWNGPAPVAGAMAEGTLDITQDSLLDFKNSVLSNVAAIISTNGSWSVTSDGILAAKKVEAETVQSSDVILVQSEERASASEGVIKDGYTATVIHNPAMKANSKVFVSFLGDPRGGYWVAEKGEGNFTVHLSQPALGDLPFEYWIVGVDDRRPADVQEEAPPAPESEAPPIESASGTAETGSASGTEEIGG